LAHLRCARIMGTANQGCRYAPPLAIVRAAFQAALGTPEACQEGSLACEQGEPRQVYRFPQNRTPAGVRGLGFASVVRPKLPGGLKNQGRPACACIRSQMPHSEVLI